MQQQFLERAKDLVGATGVATVDTKPDLFCCTSGFASAQAAVFARSSAEVQQLIALAKEHKIRLYPVSVGNNWGYGTRNPPRSDCVVLSLERMDRILHFDHELGLATLEPGVTQGALARFLDSRRVPFMVPTTGAGPKASIIGNLLERGFGITPLADHFQSLMCLEAVLADGSIYRSSLRSLGLGELAKVYKWGVGPYLDGLFAQGAFGVVTQATVALARRPEAVVALLFNVAGDNDLHNAAHVIQHVQSDLPGIIGGVNLMNARRVLAMTIPYPYQQTDERGLIPQNLLESLCKSRQIAPWTGLCTLYGPRQVVDAAAREIRSRLRAVATRIVKVTPGRIRNALRLISMVPRLERRLGGSLRAVRSALELISGTPNETALPLAYWKNRRKGDSVSGDLDPGRDGCGLIWYAPLVEMRGARVVEYVQWVSETMLKHGIEPLITLTSLSDRCFGSTIPVLFDTDDQSQVERAQQCYLSLLEGGYHRGFFPYRLGAYSMEWLLTRDPVYWARVGKIKDAVDPFGIISPGRYCPFQSGNE